MILSTPATVVADRCMRPAGRAPLSRSSFHSYPRVSDINVAAPLVRSATRVLRQNRRPAIEAGTEIADVPELTVQMLPVNAFSGRPPSAGGLKRGSRHVPVHAASGSTFPPKSVSL